MLIRAARSVNAHMPTGKRWRSEKGNSVKPEQARPHSVPDWFPGWAAELSELLTTFMSPSRPEITLRRARDKGIGADAKAEIEAAFDGLKG